MTELTPVDLDLTKSLTLLAFRCNGHLIRLLAHSLLICNILLAYDAAAELDLHRSRSR